MTQQSSRAPYIIAALLAVAPLIALSNAAPGGNDWRWGEFPTHLTIFALLLGLVAANRRRIQLAAMVPLLVTAFAVLWTLINGYLNFRKAGLASMYDELIGKLVDASVVHLAPWLVGGLYGLLAVLVIRRSRDLRKNVVHAGAWLVGVGAIVSAFTFAVESWLTLASSESHVIRSSVAWPDSKKLTIVLAAIVMAAGVAAIVAGLRKPSSNLPEARVVR